MASDKTGVVNPDLANERRKCTFNVLELTKFLDGGEENYRERLQKEEYFLSDPELTKEDVPLDLLSHEDQYKAAVAKGNALLRKVRAKQSNTKSARENVRAFRFTVGTRIATTIVKDGNPISLHHVMFIPTILGQGTEEQKDLWLTKAYNMEFIGTYAQTELGHGTFIRGLETTATYLPQTQEFEINSPTVSSYKWWPGGLGHTANHAIVMAQLYTKGACQGVHPFIVQLRDGNNHMPMPGIKIGEIGRKMGMNSTNNGFLAFDKVRIPRMNMLMKNSQVAPDGTYSKNRKGGNKLAYGSMIYVRVLIVEDMTHWLSKAATIAIRYSAVRRQSEMKPGEPEPQILDYQTQLYKLLPFLSYFYAFKMTSAWLTSLYLEVMANLEQGDMDTLPELHAMACCLKAVCTADAAHGVETMRLACGGHGYMTCSALPNCYALVTAANTYEGENTVMLLQTARALVKAYTKGNMGTPVRGIMAYLTDGTAQSGPWNKTLDWFVRAFKQVSAGKVAQCCELLKRATESGSSPETAWNCVSQKLAGAAEAHGRACLIERYVASLNEKFAELSAPLQLVMRKLCELYCVYWALLRTGDLLMFTGLRGNDVVALEDWQTCLLADLRPNAVGLVDAFDFRDIILDSALGAWDGQVYERLLASAMKSPLNAKPVHDSYFKSLAPLLKAKY